MIVDEEACIVMSIGSEARKKMQQVHGLKSLSNAEMRGLTVVKQGDQPPKSPLTEFMEQTPKILFSKSDIERTAVVGSDSLRVTIQNGDIAFSVNGYYSKVEDASSNKAKVGVRAMKIIQSEVAKMRDGTLLTNTPTTSDGIGDRRARIYERAGFGSPDAFGNMRSVVKKGKMTPVSKEQYDYMIENKHFTGNLAKSETPWF